MTYVVNHTTNWRTDYAFYRHDSRWRLRSRLERDGIGDQNGIFARRFTTAIDVVGPMAVEFRTQTGERIGLQGQIGTPISTLVVTFDEEMATTGPGSVLNPANYRMLLNGVEINGSLKPVSFGLNPATNKWEAVFSIDADGNSANGLQAISNGQWQVVLLNSLTDKVGNPLQKSGTFPIGQNQTQSFRVSGTLPGNPPVNPTNAPDVLVNTTVANNQSNASVAYDSQGNYIVVWASQNPDGTRNIFARRFDANGKALISDTNLDGIIGGGDTDQEFRVNATTVGNLTNPDVAMDDAGNFVVTWSGSGQDDNSGVFARVYNSAGVARGNEFLVNQFKTSNQDSSRVSMDTNGDFVVTWTSYGQDSDKDGIFARRYNNLGQAQGGEIQVNTTVQGRQDIVGCFHGCNRQLRHNLGKRSTGWLFLGNLWTTFRRRRSKTWR